MAEADLFVGPRPLERADAPILFGRSVETDELFSLIAANRIVLLYAAAGAGKTSLLNAGLIPLLEERGFEVLVARTRSYGGEDVAPADGANVYVRSLLSHWSSDEPTLAAFLAHRQPLARPDGTSPPRAIIVDQFEELFALYPERWPERKRFFEELADAADSDPQLRVVLALRDEYVAQVDRYARLLPGMLRARFRLESLAAEQALEAVTAPLLTSRFQFAPGVAEALVDDLLTVHAVSPRGEHMLYRAEFVEPVQLQLVCRLLLTELPPDVTVITSEHVRAYGRVDDVLSSYYDNAIAAAARAGVREGVLRKGVETGFLTETGTRAIVYRGAESTAGIPNAAIEVLEERRLLRAEFRAGARWYELTQDRMIGPILASNRRYFDRTPGRRLRRLFARAR